jgi:hypothetical protein
MVMESPLERMAAGPESSMNIFQQLYIFNRYDPYYEPRNSLV